MASLITNIKLKYDTLANWTREDMEGKGAFLVLQRGEVGFCEVPSNIEGVLPTILFKVGDGNSTFGELNWVSALASDVRPWAKAENKPEYSAAEINGLSEYITQAVKDTNIEYRFNKVNDYEYEFQSKEIGGTEWNVDFTLTIPKYDGTPAFKPTGNSYLTFSSPSSFTLRVYDTTKHWDGTLEYFSSDKVWTTWDGTTTLSSTTSGSDNILYLRGTGNTVITGGGSNYKWVLTGSDIACIGNIENLLDYATVESGSHPTMAEYCYYRMFRDCTSLTQAPTLPATTLAMYCYREMFRDCTSLTQAPALPATRLAMYCYSHMFYGCKSLTRAPALPATRLAGYDYWEMFYDCTSLTKAPALPATRLEMYCYAEMFSGCTGLTQAPALPATTLESGCYKQMFQKCTSLTQAPALPATTLAEYCYYGMFKFCYSLKLSSTQIGEYIQEYRIPSSGTGITAPSALTDMFASTDGTFTGTPEINTTYYLSTDNMIVRETEVATLNGYVGSMIAEKVTVPDWNQNDNTQPDYIKNRPFYESISLTTLLEEQQIDFSSSFDIQNNIVVGKTYIVHWDDAEYTIEATNKDLFGDGSILIPYLGQADGLFTIEGTAMNAADKGIHTVAIYTTEIDRKTIDEKFIPDSLKNKISFENPIGTGAVSFNRKTDTGIGSYSFAEGQDTTASGDYSHAEGYGTTASGMGSHAEGYGTTASGSYSHAEGQDTTASGSYSHAEGCGTTALESYCHVEGVYNIPFDEIAPVHLLHIVGNGTSEDARSNAYTLDINGNAWFAGTIEGKALILPSSTTNSTKYFRITVDDNGTISATDVTLSK